MQEQRPGPAAPLGASTAAVAVREAGQEVCRGASPCRALQSSTPEGWRRDTDPELALGPAPAEAGSEPRAGTAIAVPSPPPPPLLESS